MVDVGDALVSQKYWVSISYVGIGRFAVAIGEDVSWGLKARKVKEIKAMIRKHRQNLWRQLSLIMLTNYMMVSLATIQLARLSRLDKENKSI